MQNATQTPNQNPILSFLGWYGWPKSAKIANVVLLIIAAPSIIGVLVWLIFNAVYIAIIGVAGLLTGYFLYTKVIVPQFAKQQQTEQPKS